MGKPKQAFLSQEMEPQRIKEVEDAAENLNEIRTQRIKLNKEEDDAQTTLIAVMEKHELQVYNFDSFIVTIEPGKTKAKVKDTRKPEDPAEKEDH